MLSRLCRKWMRRFIYGAVAFVGWRLLRYVEFADIDGVAVGVERQITDHSVRARVGAALSLIKSVDPRRYRRLVHDVGRIAVVSGRLQGYSEPLGVCWLSERVMRRWSDAITAAIMVHVATQARIASAGVSAWGRAAARVRACGIRDQVAFLQGLPAGWYPDRWAYIDWLKSIANSADLSAA